jgi:lauroyl/myristoyl acyltransferase
MLISESITRDLLRLIIWYPFRWIIRFLPISWGFALFRMLGRIHYILFPGKNGLLAENLKLAFGKVLQEERLKEMILRYYENHYVDRLQIFLFPRFNKNNIDQYHTFEGLENLENALNKKQGCILIHAHIGPTQLPLCALGVIGYSVMQIGFPSDEGLTWVGKHIAFRLRQKYEVQIKASIISATSFLRPVFEHLRQNDVIMITGDGAGGRSLIGKYTRFNFFNHSFPFALGGISLAQRTGALVLPLFTVTGKGKGYKTIIEGPLDIDYHSFKNEQTLIRPMEVFVKRLQEVIVTFPYLWHFWDEFAQRSSRPMPTGFLGEEDSGP